MRAAQDFAGPGFMLFRHNQAVMHGQAWDGPHSHQPQHRPNDYLALIEHEVRPSANTAIFGLAPAFKDGMVA